jgi:cobalt/nickel transport system permease protein
MDMLSCQDTALHRLDPRVKVLTTVLFLVSVLSFDRYSLSALAPFTVFPAYLIAAGNLPPAYILKKLVTLSPFALMVALFNPVFDRETMVLLGPVELSGGWISFFSIMARFGLTVSAALALIGCTGFYGLCHALGRLGAPRGFVVQLLFLYRYIFVLTEEAARMVRARNLRSFDRRGRGLAVYGPLAGTLLLRSIDRAKKIHRAMVSRGFDGQVRLARAYAWAGREWLFLFLWTAVFMFFRLCDPSRVLGDFVMRVLS